MCCVARLLKKIWKRGITDDLPQCFFFSVMRNREGLNMWYFAWILGLPLAAAFAVLNAMWYELMDDAAKHKAGFPADERK